MAKKNRAIIDPFKELASGLGKSTGESIWEEEPVDIEEFICGKNFLNQRWNGKTGCRPAILEIAKAVADDNIREAMLLLGKGSGKDYIASILHLHGIHTALCLYDPQTYYGLAPGSPMYFVNVARNEGQAKNVFFTGFLGMLENCPWFQGKYEAPSGQSVQFDKKVRALSGNSQAFGWLGYNTIQWVGDELAFFLEKDANEESASKAEDCWEAAYGSCQTRFGKHYKMIGITTPRYDDDFVMQKCFELDAREDGYFIQKATWEVNPLQTIEDYKHALARNYRRTMRDFGAEPMGVIESFWGEPEFVEENVCQACRECPVYKGKNINTSIYACREYDLCRANAYRGNGEWAEWLHPDNVDDEYCLHFDLSKNKDRLGFGLSHVVGSVQLELDNFELQDMLESEDRLEDLNDIEEDDKHVEKALIKVDAVGFIAPNSMTDGAMLKNGEIRYHAVLNKIILPLKDKGINVVKITFDQYQSLYLKQQLEDRGYNVDLLSCDRTDEVPVNAKRAFVENRIEYPYDKVLASEAKKLKYIKGKKVDHPTGKELGASKDVWDGVAGSIWNCEQEVFSTGSFCDLSDDED